MVVAQVTLIQAQDWLEKLTKNLYKQEMERVTLYQSYVHGLAKHPDLVQQPEFKNLLVAHILVIKLLRDLFNTENPEYSNYCQQIAIALEHTFGWPVIVQGENLSNEILDYEISILKILLLKAQKLNDSYHQRMMKGNIALFENSKQRNALLNSLR